MTYEETIEYIFSIPKFTKKNASAHTERLLELLNNPQNSFRILHVAGSNGKGSVCAFLNSILQCAGYSAGLFTSPHLIDVRERFCINGSPCSIEQFQKGNAAVVTAIERMSSEGLPHPTFFEYIFALGMVIFRDAKVEYAVLETGLGGRLDATNIIKKPLLTILTSISLEHAKILGDTIEQIAAEKAGIIKKSVPVVFDGSDKSASDVIIKEAVKKRAPYKMLVPSDINILLNNHKMIAFQLNTGYYKKIIEIPFCAPYQTMNAALAFEAMMLLKSETKIKEADILAGLHSVSWPGRMQEIQPRVLVDGAHNASAMMEFIKAVKILTDRPAVLLFSIGQEKEYRKVIHLLCKEQLWESIVVTNISGGQSVASKELKQLFLNETPKYKIDGTRKKTEVYDAANTKAAYQLAMQLRQENQYLFCVGSLYLVGEVMQRENIVTADLELKSEVEYDRF